MELPRVLTKYRSEIDEEIRSIINGRNLPLYDMMRYHLGFADEDGRALSTRSGKAIRPALLLFSCEALGGNYHSALPAAAAIELVHNYTLIHDDIQDDDRERRHRPTVWAIWGKPQAINVGSAMRFLAGAALERMRRDSVPALKVLQLGRRLDEVTLSVIEGQYLDISFENRADINENDYLTMIEKKTGSLISGAMEMGAIISTNEETAITGFSRIGIKIGLAFQIVDDMLGIWGNNSETGKPAGNDIRRRKKSFPFVYALENSSQPARKELLRIYAKMNIDEIDIENVFEIYDLCNARLKGQQLADAYCAKASDEFIRFPVSIEAREGMQQIVSFLTGRTY